LKFDWPPFVQQQVGKSKLSTTYIAARQIKPIQIQQLVIDTEFFAKFSASSYGELENISRCELPSRSVHLMNKTKGKKSHTIVSLIKKNAEKLFNC
jgi:hypothetical protein